MNPKPLASSVAVIAIKMGGARVLFSYARDREAAQLMVDQLRRVGLRAEVDDLVARDLQPGTEVRR
jgi:hypothetical protein